MDPLDTAPQEHPQFDRHQLISLERNLKTENYSITRQDITTLKAILAHWQNNTFLEVPELNALPRSTLAFLIGFSILKENLFMS